MLGGPIQNKYVLHLPVLLLSLNHYISQITFGPQNTYNPYIETVKGIILSFVINIDPLSVDSMFRLYDLMIILCICITNNSKYLNIEKT